MPSRAFFSRLRAEESGFTIIEVLVSAIIVVIVSVGVLKSLDTANARSGTQKAKGVAAGLAQQDQERLRAFRAQDLNNYVETRCLQKRPTGFVKDPGCDDDPLLGPSYKIVSRTDWVSDQSGTRSCGTGARADYIRISSTVSWSTATGDAETGTNRVSIASLVAPRVGTFSGEGSLSIEVQDRNAAGRANIPVSVTGPKTLSGTTDANGCLFFGYLPEGNYTVAVSQAGNVDANGVQDVSRQFGVTDGSITTAVIEYDLGANLDVTFTTRVFGVTYGGQRADHLSIAHSGLASPSWRAYTSTQGGLRPEDSFGLGTGYTPKLFPFSSEYAAYAGNCPGNRPSFYGLTWTQFSPVLTPGGTATMTVHQPSILLTPGGTGATAWPGGNIPTGAIAALKPEATWGGSPTYCTETKYAWTLDGGPTANEAWLLNFWEPVPYSFGFPIGAYDLCMAFNDGTGWKYELHNLSAGHALQPLDDGPTGTHANFTVPKPTGSTSCF